MPRGGLPLVKLSQLVGLPLLSSFFYECLILVRNLYQLSASVRTMQLCKIDHMSALEGAAALQPT